MSRAISKVAPGWWDYTTLDDEILGDAARLTARRSGGFRGPVFVC